VYGNDCEEVLTYFEDVYIRRLEEMHRVDPLCFI